MLNINYKIPYLWCTNFQIFFELSIFIIWILLISLAFMFIFVLVYTCNSIQLTACMLASALGCSWRCPAVQCIPFGFYNHFILHCFVIYCLRCLLPSPSPLRTRSETCASLPLTMDPAILGTAAAAIRLASCSGAQCTRGKALCSHNRQAASDRIGSLRCRHLSVDSAAV